MIKPALCWHGLLPLAARKARGSWEERKGFNSYRTRLKNVRSFVVGLAIKAIKKDADKCVLSTNNNNSNKETDIDMCLRLFAY